MGHPFGEARRHNPGKSALFLGGACVLEFVAQEAPMTDLILTTFDWVPKGPRGFVRDLRVRWALEEAGLPYRVESTPFRDRGADHLAHQPFGQVPWLTDGDISMFESGAILLHLGERSEALMPTDPHLRSEVIEWVFAALNSVEMASLPWALFAFGGERDTPGWKRFDDFVKLRLQRMEPVLAGREWLVADAFSVADILMADVLRLVDRFDGLEKFPACRAYVARATARPAFVKAHADQMAHFAAAD
jgi:glutathione S-transferase